MSARPLSEIDRIRGALLGLAVGDAVGTSLEFQPPGTFEPIDDMIGGGPFHLKPGEWTDDTSMALCLGESLREAGFDPADQMDRYTRWLSGGYMSSTGSCFAAGWTTSNAIARFVEIGQPFAGSIDEDSAGNGSLMRLAPVPIWASPDEELARLTDLYDACIRYTDAEIGRFLDALARRRANRERIVIITADHGDEFMEHGSLYHNNILYEELIRVPLVLWWSDGSHAGTRVEGLARHVDVLPTMAEWLGIPTPEQAMGSSLTPLITGEETGARETIAEGDFCAAVVYEGWKILRVDSSGVDYLYDLSADPGETENLAAREPQRLEDMRRRLDAYLALIEEQGGEERRATSETLRQLRALGYVN